MLRSINSFFPPKVHNGPSTKQKEKIKNKWIFVNIQYMYATPATKPTVTENKSKIKSLKKKIKKKSQNTFIFTIQKRQVHMSNKANIEFT